MKVLAVKPNPKKPEQAYVTLGTIVPVPTADDPNATVVGESIEAWCPSLEAVKPLLGKDLPPDWTQDKGEYGPRLLPPRDRKGGGAVAYRNTKEGQAYEQERMDRRTALMQAVAAGIRMGPETHPYDAIVRVADQMYEWLRKSSGVAAAGPAVGPAEVRAGTDSTPGTTSAPPLRNPSGSAGADEPSGPKADSVSKDRGDGSASLGGMQESVQAQPAAPDERWEQARELGLSPPKAVMMARKLGWDTVRSSVDLSDEQLLELIRLRTLELQT